MQASMASTLHAHNKPYADTKGGRALMNGAADLDELIALHEKFMRGELNGRRLNLAYAIMRKVSFRGKNLKFAEFKGANLSWCDFSDTNLEGASFYSCNLIGAKHAYPVNTYTYYMLDVSSRQNKARHRSAPRPRLRFPAMI